MKVLKPLIMDKDKISIGRIAFWITFFMLCAYWIKIIHNVSAGSVTPDAPNSLVTIFISLLSYEVFKKGKDVLQYHIETKNNSNTTNNQ